MEPFIKNVVIFVPLFLLFTVNQAVDGDNTFSNSKIEQFPSKINSNVGSDNLGGVRNTRSTQFVQEITLGEEQETDARLLTKRNLRVLQNTMSKMAAMLESLDGKVCGQQPDENSTVIEHIFKNAVKLDNIEQNMCKRDADINYTSLFHKVEDVQKNIVKKSDLQNIQDNILRAVESQLKPNEKFSDCTINEPKSTKEDILKYLKSMSGSSHTISGVSIDGHDGTARSGDLIHNITGVHPGIWGVYLYHSSESILQNELYIDEAIAQWNNGSLVSIQWYACPPTSTESCTTEEMNTRRFNSSEWNDLITDGGHLNKLWKVRLNSMVVPFLKRLESVGVVVIFDPFIYMNFNFWWGGNRDANGSRLLYQITHDFLTKTHNLNSIIWKWSLLFTPDLETYMEQFWPGNEYVDVASVVLMTSKEPSDAVYERTIQIVGDKPMTLELCFSVPTSELLKKQSRWTWFAAYASVLKNPQYNNDTDIKAVFENPAIINRGFIDVLTRTNYALKGKATTSSVQGADLKADLAIDGSNTTRWSSEFSDPQWLQIDLGQVKILKKIKIIWEVAFAKGYQIQASEDKAAWKIVHEEYNGQGGVEEIPINFSLSARYLKLLGFKRGSVYGYSIYELEVY